MANNKQIATGTARVTWFTRSEPSGVIGAAGYADHDPTAAWDDGGLATSITDEDIGALQKQINDSVNAYIDQFKIDAAREMKNYGAGQVQEAVVEYITQSPMELATIEGELAFVMDASNEQAELRPFWTLREMFTQAIERAKEQQMHAELGDALNDLFSSVQDHFAPPKPPPQEHPAVPSQSPRGTRRLTSAAAAPPGGRRRRVVS